MRGLRPEKEVRNCGRELLRIDAHNGTHGAPTVRTIEGLIRGVAKGSEWKK